MTRRTRYIEPLARRDAVRVFQEDRENWNWLFCHFARELTAASENGLGDSAWAYYLLDGMKAIGRKDADALDAALEQLQKLAGND